MLSLQFSEKIVESSSKDTFYVKLFVFCIHFVSRISLATTKPIVSVCAQM